MRPNVISGGQLRKCGDLLEIEIYYNKRKFSELYLWWSCKFSRNCSSAKVSLSWSRFKKSSSSLRFGLGTKRLEHSYFCLCTHNSGSMKRDFLLALDFSPIKKRDFFSLWRRISLSSVEEFLFQERRFLSSLKKNPPLLVVCSWEFSFRLGMRPCISQAFLTPLIAAWAVFLVYPIGQGSFSDGMPLGISGTFNFMLVFQAV